MNVSTKRPLGSLQVGPYSSFKKILIGVALLTLCIVGLNMVAPQVKSFFFAFANPVSGIVTRTGEATANFFSGLFNGALLTKENAILKNENYKLLADLSVLKETMQVQQHTKSALENTKHNGFSLQVAGVIGLDIQNDTMLIDKGSNDGILENMPVISKEKVLFGRVLKSYPAFSRVMLISSKKSALAGKIQAPEAVYGSVKGGGNLSIYMDLINADSAINPGDILTTSAQDGIFPKDLLIGKIESRNTNDSGAFQTAKIFPFFDPKNTGTIFVITDYLTK